ncbi:MAG: PIG-L family deacetylase [Candidatus Thermoplasmatota archaeon]|nr:PIG-L family deacetylase [Candidatus Thermoplasmatota archaeon]
MKRILLFGSHPDDVEIGMGGSVLKYKDKYEFLYLCFSKCLDLERNANLMDEYKRAVDFMGIKSEILDFPNRRFPEHSFDIREVMEEKKQTFEPDVVFCPASCDIHQDHNTLYREAYRVFRNKSIMGYANSRSSMGFQPNLYVTLEEEIVKKKIELLEIYRSQSGRYYMTQDALMSPINFYGIQVGTRYAEGFEIIRAII